MRKKELKRKERIEEERKTDAEEKRGPFDFHSDWMLPSGLMRQLHRQTWDQWSHFGNKFRLQMS